VYELESSLAVGPVFARHIATRLYRGEYYVMQIDSHVTFVNDWDVDIISQFERTKNEMAVLSTRLMDSVGNIDEKTGKTIKTSRNMVCNSDFIRDGSNGKFMQHQKQAALAESSDPLLQPFWAAGFSFARGHFLINVPYDPHLPMIFQGEEISMSLRAFSYGYDFYTPAKNICFHTDCTQCDETEKHFREHANLYKG